MKYYLNNYFLFAFAMMSQCAFGQLFGAKNVIIENAGFLYDIKIVDFDNNLSNDLMVVGNNRVSMYKNLNGNGDFSQEIEIDPNMNQSFSLGLGDLNGDSFYDLVVSFFDEGALKIYFNDGYPNGNYTVTPQDSTQINDPSLILNLDPGLYNIQKEYDNGTYQETMILKENN